MQKPMTRSTPARLYQEAVEEDDLAPGRQMGHVALEVPLPRLALGGLLQGHHAGAAGIEAFHEPLDGAALAGRVASLADHDDPLAGVLHPPLHLQQLDLQDAFGPVVLRPADLAVVGVVLPPGLDRGAVGVEEHGPLGTAVVHLQSVEQIASARRGVRLLGRLPVLRHVRLLARHVGLPPLTCATKSVCPRLAAR
ncbi:hypothetical protein RKD26_006507 [Streptomyces calvus]